MKEIIILGGGFAGVSAAHFLQDKLKNEANITLIDKNPYHLFHASLYEVATSEQPKKNIAIPYSEIFNKHIKIIKGIAENIDTDNQQVQLKNGTNYSYDYLIVALGSVPAYFGIEGLYDYSIPLKNVEDAVSIRKKIEEVYHQKVIKGSRIEIIVGGGGFSGTEFAAELIKYREKLAKHHKRQIEQVGITVIQGSSSLLKELDERVSVIAQKRLEAGGIKIVLNAHIQKVNKNQVETDNGDKYSYDILVWTGGVKANPILEKSGFKINGRGQVSVDEKMRIQGYSNVFAAGDIAEFADPHNNKPVPGVAQVAEDEGRLASENVYRSVKNMDLISYKFKHLGYIIPLKGRFAVADFKSFRVVGLLGWFLQQMVFLYYLLKIMPISKALRRWDKFEMYLMQNS